MLSPMRRRSPASRPSHRRAPDGPAGVPGAAVDDAVEFEREFQRARQRDRGRLMRVAALVGLAMLAMFASLDPWALSDGVLAVWSIRGFVVVVLIGLLGIGYRAAFARQYEWLVGAAFLLVGVAVLAVIGLSSPGDAARTAYFGGVLLVLFALFVFSYLRARTMHAIAAFLLVAYLVESWWLGDLREGGTWPTVIANAFVFVASWVFGTIAAFERDRHARKSFERKRQLEQELDDKERARRLHEHQSYHDSLTGLPNRELFLREFRALLASAGPSGSVAAVLFLDLDGFKPVNDQYGHLAGDHVLRVIAQRIRAGVAHDDLAARLGGDEFAVALSLEPDDETGALELTRRIAARIESHVIEPIRVDDGIVQLGVSIGIALYPADGDSVDALLATADSRMYLVKRAHKVRRGEIGVGPHGRQAPGVDASTHGPADARTGADAAAPPSARGA